MKLRILISVLMISALYSEAAITGTITCEGKVKTLAYHANNQLMIQLESMNAPVFFCSPDSEWSVSGTVYVTGPDSCKTMYSTFLAAQMSGKVIKSMYFDGDQTPASCSGWGNWSRANIRFYRLDD
jgi:hypothetical protein